MTPADTNRTTIVWPLADFFDALRREGFRLRPDDYFDVVRVLDAFRPTSYADLQALIAPLIVTSDEEQAKFDRIFQTIQRKNELQPLVRTAQKRRSTRWVWLAAGLLTVLVLGYVAFLWPGPAFKTDIDIAGPFGPSEVGDTLRLSVDSSMRKAAGPLARWQWETSDGRLLPNATEPVIEVVAERAGPVEVRLRSQRGRGLLFTSWTDSLRNVEYPICNKLPVVQIDSVRLSTNPLRYRFRGRLTGSAKPVQLTRWWLNNAVVARNQVEWENSFRSQAGLSNFYVRFEAVPDTTQPLCFSDASLTVSVRATQEPYFTVSVQQTGNRIDPAGEISNFYRGAIVMAAILLLVALGLYVWLMRRDAQKRALDRSVPQAETPESASPSDPENPLAGFVSDEPPLEIPLENREAELITRDQQFYHVVRTLRQPAESENWRLHIPQTMQATMRGGGFPTLVFRPHLSETEYLFLIDRSQVRSQQVALFEYMFGAFVRESVCADRFFFHRKFDTFTNETHPKGVTISQLADTYRNRTLIIWGDGYPLLYPSYPVVEPAIRNALTDWETRAILTPVPFADWGSKEWALQGDFLLLPADLTGQLRLIQALTEKQPNQDAYLARPEHGLYPTDSVNFRDVSELSDYLGDTLFQWLAAVAIYPRIRWEVVVEMGRALLPPEAINFTNLLKLVRISWMHEGSFPDRTRFELLKELRPDNEVKARRTLLQMLAYSERYFPGEHFFDGEKYILRTVNQFALYAHNPTAFASYQPAEQTFRTLHDKGLYPDGPSLRYLENPAGNWVTLLPVRVSPPTKAGKPAISQLHSVSLRDYFDEPPTETPEETPEIDQSVNEEPIKQDSYRPHTWVSIAAVAMLLIFISLEYLSRQPQNRIVDLNQRIPITIVLDINACVTALNTSVTDNSRWSVRLNDSLYSISNLYATRSFALEDLIFDSAEPGSAESLGMSITLSVRDTSGGGQIQSSTVQLVRDTLRVRINCRPDGFAYPLDSIIPYNPEFVGNQPIPLPSVTARPGAYDQLTGQVFNYVHYSLVMDESRAMPLYVAYNVERTTMKNVPRQPDDWKLDPRIPVALQTGAELYRANEWDIGNMVPRRAVMWGDSLIAARAAQSTLYYSSAVPQHQTFNQGNWNVLENFVLQKLRPTAKRLSVFAGPVYRQTDFAYRGRRIPRSFWMIAIVGDEKNPRNFFVYAYLMDQYTLEPDGSLKPVPSVGNFNPSLYQVNVSQIEAITPLRFGGLGSAYRGSANRTNSPAYVEPTPQQSNDKRSSQQQTAPTNQTAAPVQSGTESLRLRSENPTDSFVTAGIRAYQRGQYDEAIRQYDQSLAKNPNNAYALNLKGYSLFKLARYDEAVNILLTATKTNPKYAWAYFDLARVYCALGRRTEADNARQQAISLNPSLEKIMQNDREFMNLCETSAK